MTLALFLTELKKAVGHPGSLSVAGSDTVLVEFSTDPGLPISAVEWHVEGVRLCRLRISPLLVDLARIRFLAGRLGAIWPLFNEYYAQVGRDVGSVYINLDDHTVIPGLSFCGRGKESFLIPDSVFLTWNGYASTRDYYLRSGLEWRDRKAQAVWRGTTTGRSKGDWRSLPRVQLCRISREHPSLLDAGFSAVVQLSETAAMEIASEDLLRDAIDVRQFGLWRYQIDIDGNSNSWPGLFQKLLSGSSVIKVTSDHGWRQWYYDRLIPWKNFVPVEADMSDLREKISWLQQHDEEAEEIGLAGQGLATSMTYENEVGAAISVIQTALHLDLPETLGARKSLLHYG